MLISYWMWLKTDGGKNKSDLTFESSTTSETWFPITFIQITDAHTIACGSV